MIKRIIIVLSILICATIIFIMAQSNKKVVTANWNERYSTLEELYYNSDVIFVGKVTSLNPYKLYEMIFTNAEVEVSNVIKGNLDSVVNVKYTGGKIDKQDIQLYQSKLPSLNNMYIFFVNYDNESIYVPVNYQGTYRVYKNKIVQFNTENELEKLLLEKNVNSIGEEAKEKIKNTDLSKLEKPNLNIYYLSDALVKCRFIDDKTLKVEKVYWGNMKENQAFLLSDKYIGKKILEKKEYLEIEDKFTLNKIKDEIILALKDNDNGSYSVMYGNNGVYQYDEKTNEFLNFRGYKLTEEYIQILKLDWETNRSK